MARRHAFYYAHIVALSLASSVLAAGATAQPLKRAGFDGIYVISTPRRPLTGGPAVSIALKNKYVDGAFLTLNWDSVQPSPSQLEWDALDAQIAVAAKLHKKVTLAVTPGSYTPNWVYTAGAASFTTVVEPDRQVDFCAPVRLPIPWDPVFLHAWLHFVRAFGARYASNKLVSLVKITGINYRTTETSLPFGTYVHLPADRRVTSASSGRTCTIPDDVGEWRAMGYTGAKVDAAFEQIAATFKSAFPGMPMAIMTSERSFPPLDGGGNPDPNGYSLATHDLFAIGRRLFGDDFVGQFNGLSAVHVDAGVAAFSRTNPTGYQAAWYIHGDSVCVMNARRRPCDENKIFQDTIDQATRAHARYIELFDPDINNPPFAPALRAAHLAFGG